MIAAREPEAPRAGGMVHPGGSADARAGDAAIWQRHYEAVRRYCVSRTGGGDDAEDAVQDTFVRFLERADRQIANPEAWLIQAAGWACLDIARRRRVRTAASLSEDPGLASVPSAEDVALDGTLVEGVLQGMRPRDAGILRDVYLRGHSITAVAHARGLAEGSVRMMLMRARRRAREAVGALGAGLAALRLRNLRRAASEWREGAALPGSAGALVAAALVAAMVLLPGGPLRQSTQAAAAAAGARGGATGAFVGAPLVTPAAARGGGAAHPVGAGPSRPRLPQRPATLLSPLPLPDPGQHASSVNSRFSYIVPAPDYPAGPVFAMGNQQQSCYYDPFTSSSPLDACLAVFFDTLDRGASWNNLHADSLGYGRVLVSPNYAADSTVFVLEDSVNGGLQISTNGGASFSPTAAQARAAQGAIAASPAGGSRVAFLTDSTGQLAYYDEGTLASVGGGGGVLPGPPLDPELSPDSVAFLGSSEQLEVGGTLPTGTSDVVSCELIPSGLCGLPVDLPGSSQDQWVRLASVLPVGPVGLAYGKLGAWITRDAGTTWQPIGNLPVGGLVEIEPVFGFAGSGTLLVISDDPADPASSVVSVGQVSGNAFTLTQQNTVPWVFDSAAILSDGRILGSRFATGTQSYLGLACSTNGGGSWTSFC